MKGGGKREHFGPEPNMHGGGAATIHALVHEASAGRTVAAVYLGDCKPLESDDDEPFYSEYLFFEFTDGSILPLAAGASNSFALATPREMKEILAHVKRSKRSVGAKGTAFEENR